ncbi:MAG: TonB family protein [Pseudomonadota bacterium]
MRDFAIASLGAATVTAALLMLMTALLADDSVSVIQTVRLPPTLADTAVPTPPPPPKPFEHVEPIDKPVPVPTDRPSSDDPIERVTLPPAGPDGAGPTVPSPPGEVMEGTPGFGNGNDALIELVNVTPIYPTRMLALGIEGYVDVRFDVTAMGRAENVEVTYATHRGFEKAAIKGVERIRYQPRTVDGNAVPVRGIEKRFSFNIRE